MGKRWYGLVRRRPAIAGLGVVLGVGAILPAPAEADAPPCRYTIEPETVVDNDTGLTWQRTVDGGTYTWSNAASYCQGLPLAGGGWRLPSIQELQTLVDDSTYNPAIAQHPGILVLVVVGLRGRF